MVIYIVLIAFLMLFSLGRAGKTQKKTVLAIAMTALWLVSSLRAATVGNDTKVYYDLFTSICTFDSISSYVNRYEIGYLLLNRFVSLFSDSFQVFLMVVNAIIYYAYYRFFEKYAENPVFSVFLFIVVDTFGMTMNAIRMHLAIAMVIYAFLIRENGKSRPQETASISTKKLFGRPFLSVFRRIRNGLRVNRRSLGRNLLCILFLVLAVSMQRIAIVYIAAFLIPEKSSKKFMFFSTFCVGVFFVLFYALMRIVFNFVPYYMVYMDQGNSMSGGNIATLFKIAMHASALLLSGYIFYRSRKLKYPILLREEASFPMQMNMVYTGTLILILSWRFNQFERCAGFFLTFTSTLLPNAIHKLSLKKQTRWLIGGAVMLAGLLYFIIVNVFRPEWNTIIPYEFFFQ